MNGGQVDVLIAIGLLVLIMDVIVILVIENVIAQNVGNYVTLKMLIKHLAMLIKFYTYKQIQTIQVLKREVNSKCKFYI